MNIHEKRAKYKVMEIRFRPVDDSNRDKLEVQKEFIKHLVVDRIYPSAVELRLVGALDLGLVLWYDQSELRIELGTCTALIHDVICNNVPIHFAIYKE